MPSLSNEVREEIRELVKEIMCIVHTEVDQESDYSEREKNLAWYMIMAQLAAMIITMATSVVQEEEGK